MNVDSEPNEYRSISYTASSNGTHVYESFRFLDLPIELQIQVLQYIIHRHELLRFRLVSKLVSSLVLEPVFWHEISFSGKQQLKKSSTGATFPFYHGSDANVIHQLSRNATSPLSPSSQQTLSLSAGTSFSPQRFGPVLNSNSHSLDSNKSRIESSFLSFVTLLSTQGTTAHNINSVTIEKWEGMSSIEAVWRTLTKFQNITNLSIKHSSIGSVRIDPIFSKKNPWNYLNRLELKDCLNLVDISEIIVMIPNLHNLSLEGCLQITDFTSLAPVGMQNLPYKSVNLSCTKVADFELINLLKGSPQLQELRLEQCYFLTAISLEAIGYNHDAEEAEIVDGANPSQSDPASGVTTMGVWTTLTSTICQKLKVLSLKDCCDLADESVRSLAGCRQLEYLNIRGLRHVNEDTADWLHSQGVPLRKVLSPLGRWRYWH